MSEPPPLPQSPAPAGSSPLATPGVQVIPDDLSTRLRAPRRRWPLLLGIGGMLAAVLLACVGTGVLLAWFGLIARAVPASAGYIPEDPTVKQTSAQFNSAGTLIAVEQFEPIQPGKYPVVLVLHGFDGLQHQAWRDYYHGQCQELARNNHIALLVRYFDRTDTATSDQKTAQKHFSVWAQTVLDALSYAAQLPGNEGKKIGIVGTSLGGVLGSAVAGFDARIGAVVQISAALPDGFIKKIKKMPPLLILHGEIDRVVPVERARVLDQELRERKLSSTLHTYPDQGHVFRGAAARDALDRTVEFLQQQLKEVP